MSYPELGEKIAEAMLDAAELMSFLPEDIEDYFWHKLELNKSRVEDNEKFELGPATFLTDIEDEGLEDFSLLPLAEADSC